MRRKKKGSLSPYLSQDLKRLCRRFWVASLRTKKECFNRADQRIHNFPEKTVSERQIKYFLNQRTFARSLCGFIWTSKGFLKPLVYLFWWPSRGLSGLLFVFVTFEGSIARVSVTFNGFKIIGTISEGFWWLLISCVFGFHWSKAFNL